jgi:hypothetical protein
VTAYFSDDELEKILENAFFVSAQYGNSEAVCNIFVVVPLFKHLASCKLRPLIGCKYISVISAKTRFTVRLVLHFADGMLVIKLFGFLKQLSRGSKGKGEGKISIDQVASNPSKKVKSLPLNRLLVFDSF